MKTDYADRDYEWGSWKHSRCICL